MKINPIWAVCIMVRTLIVFIAIYISTKSYNIRLIGCTFLLTIGIGFLIKSLTGSNNETQLSKVFWHDTRLVHSMFYILAGYYLYNGNSKIGGLLLTLDIIFSISYRIVTDQ
jgi:hypothetical protein